MIQTKETGVWVTSADVFAGSIRFRQTQAVLQEPIPLLVKSGPGLPCHPRGPSLRVDLFSLSCFPILPCWAKEVFYCRFPWRLFSPAWIWRLVQRFQETGLLPHSVWTTSCPGLQWLCAKVEGRLRSCTLCLKFCDYFLISVLGYYPHAHVPHSHSHLLYPFNLVRVKLVLFHASCDEHVWVVHVPWL